jgi:hypothetical protein
MSSEYRRPKVIAAIPRADDRKHFDETGADDCGCVSLSAAAVFPAQRITADAEATLGIPVSQDRRVREK